MLPILATTIGARIQRLDLPCAALGLPAPPASLDLKMLHHGGGWSVSASCAQRAAGAVTDWLHAFGASDVQRGGEDPAVLRARFPRLPAPCRLILQECRLESASLRPDGGASLVVRGADDAVARLTLALGHAAGRDDAVQTPPLTPRQAELLQYCVARGYYSIPRKASLRRLNAELGISTTSLSIALRRAEGKIIVAHAARLRAADPSPGHAEAGPFGQP